MDGNPVEIRFEQDASGGEIQDFITAAPRATFFHSPAWLKILAESFSSFECGWITARRQQELVGIMPLARISRGPFFSLYSLPFGTYGHPIAIDEHTGKLLLDRFVASAGSSRCVEAAANLFDPGMYIEAPKGWAEIIEECRIIRLGDSFEEYRSQSMSRKKRQLCNRCEREGVEARIMDSAVDLDIFYDVYLRRAVGWGGVHPYPKHFFRNLFSYSGNGVIVRGAFLGGRLIAAHIDFYFNDAAQAWQAGLTPEAHEYDASAFLVMNSVREAIGRGISTFNLGSSGNDQGMIFFKESMGGTEYRYPVITRRRKWWGWLKRR
jgi:hypothetical protein